MNYYPFHIGDFAAHTSHLSWEEDIAYRRMLDWYYLNEKALPFDVAKVARLIRMPKSLPAIQVVLDEFFVKSEDGWHNKRADAELTAMLAKQEQQATKDEHEAERMRRYRERRAMMFAALRAVHVVPAWDVPMKELQRLYDTHCNAPETDLQREQVVSGNGPATAIPTPTPTPTPLIDTSPNGDVVTTAGAAADPPEQASSSDDHLPDPCPHQQIIDLYHHILPMGRTVREWTPARAKALRARWREKEKRQNLDWWERFFRYVAESRFLTGQVSTSERGPFEVSLDWLIRAETFAKVVEGKYHAAEGAPA